MSECQYYEFAAIDEPLSDRQMRELRAISTRAEVTSTSFVNEYNFGDFKGNPRKLMESYFDAFLYFANWGTRRCMFRIPLELVDLAAWKAFAVPEVLTVSKKGKFVIVEFFMDDEAGEFEVDYGLQLSALIPARAALVEGQLGPLYVGWLGGVEAGLVEPEAEEPCDPGDLGPRSAGVSALAGLLGVRLELLVRPGTPRRKVDSVYANVRCILPPGCDRFRKSKKTTFWSVC